MGSDKTALCKRTGSVVTDIKSWGGLDLMQTVGRVKAEYDALEVWEQDQLELMVDSVGMGAGVSDRLQELGLPVRAVNVSESPSMKETYLNLRAELWFRMKAWLENRTCKIPQNDKLLSELTSLKYTFTSSGKIKAESKQELKKRGFNSPDLADSLALTFASDPATAMSGAFKPFRGELRRNLQGIA